jgi:hypothetical protein
MQETSATSGTVYRIIIALLVCAAIAGIVFSLLLAVRDGTGVADRDYYKHSLQYGRTRTGANNPGLWWTMTASLAARDLQVRISDRTGAPVTGGELSFEPPPGAAIAAIKLEESAPGLFHAPRPVSSQEKLHGTLRYRRGDAFAVRKVVLLN